MKIVFAPDSFKDSLSAEVVADILEKKAGEFFRDCEMCKVPLADGDKGTVNALLAILEGSRGHALARDYRGEMTEVEYGVLEQDTMVIETAGLLWERETESCSVSCKIMSSSSYGVGELIRFGLDQGYRKIYIGAGASVVNDGGMGCLQALGVRFYGSMGCLLEGSGENLNEITEINTEELDPRILEASLTVMCAFNNTLTGEQGVTYTYGARHGADPAQLLQLEKGMRRLGTLLEKLHGHSVCEQPGTGAGGGFPAALHALCGARLTSGISTVLDLIGFEQIVEGASLVVVGEGIVNQSSIYGKAMAGIGMLCKAREIPVVAVVGSMERGAEQLYHYGIHSMAACVNAVMEQAYVVENAEELLSHAAERLFRLLIVGMRMQTGENCLADIQTRKYRREEEPQGIHWAVKPDESAG